MCNFATLIIKTTTKRLLRYENILFPHFDFPVLCGGASFGPIMCKLAIKTYKL